MNLLNHVRSILKKEYIINNIFPIILFIFFIFVYTVTIYPGIGGRIFYGDSVGWQYLHLVNGIPHEPGYPLFMILTKIFNIIMPFDLMAYRITAIAVFFGTLTVVLIYFISYYLGNNKFGSCFSALMMGLSYTFWTQSTEAEVYTLNGFFITIIIMIFFKYHDTQNRKFLLLGSFLYAISFGNHITMIWLLPSLIYITFKTDKRVFVDKKIILSVISFILLGISQYGYLYYLSHSTIEIPHLSYIDKNVSILGVLEYMTCSRFGDRLFVFTIHELIFNRIPYLLYKLHQQFNIFGIIAIILGLYYWYKENEKKTQIKFLFLFLFFQSIYALNYKIVDIEVYFIPIYLILVLFISFLFTHRVSKEKKIIHAGLVVLSLTVSLILNIQFSNIIVKENVRLNEVTRALNRLPEESTLLTGDKYYTTSRLHDYINITKEFGDYTVTNDLNNIDEDRKFYFTDEYQQIVKSHRLYKIRVVHKSPTIKEYMIKNRNHIMILSVKTEAAGALLKSNEMKEFFKGIGSKIDTLKYGGSYIGVINHGEVAFERISNRDSIKIKSSDEEKIKALFKNHNINLYSGGLYAGNRSIIRMDGVDYAKNEYGINIVVFNNDFEFLDSKVFPTYTRITLEKNILSAEPIITSDQSWNNP